MNEWNIGVDIVEIARFQQLDYSSNKQFYKRVFTLNEIKYCLSFSSPAPHFAANFAGKEAVRAGKATGRQIGKVLAGIGKKKLISRGSFQFTEGRFVRAKDIGLSTKDKKFEVYPKFKNVADDQGFFDEATIVQNLRISVPECSVFQKRCP